MGERLAPLATLLEESRLAQFIPRFDELGLDMLEAFDDFTPLTMKQLLTAPEDKGGVGMSEKDADRFREILSSKLFLMQSSDPGAMLDVMKAGNSNIMGKSDADESKRSRRARKGIAN